MKRWSCRFSLIKGTMFQTLGSLGLPFCMYMAVLCVCKL